jgi:hypothetical protein
VWNGPVGVGSVAGSLLCGGVGGVTRCWALRNQAPVPGWVRGVLVFLWLFGCWIVDASIFVAVCSDRSVDRLLAVVVPMFVGARGWGF